jgi:hypothetical protein
MKYLYRGRGSTTCIVFNLLNNWLLMFNLGHNYINGVTNTDGYRSGYNETEIHCYITGSFVGEDGLPNL